jgi:hypothetical protein
MNWINLLNTLLQATITYYICKHNAFSSVYTYICIYLRVFRLILLLKSSKIETALRILMRVKHDNFNRFPLGCEICNISTFHFYIQCKAYNPTLDEKFVLMTPLYVPCAKQTMGEPKHLEVTLSGASMPRKLCQETMDQLIY